MGLRRILRSKVLLVMFIISLVWTLSLFLAPLTLAPGTVANLDGNASRVDYGARWDELPIYQKIIYYLGDVQCHQIANRSFYINGNQMPVCARDVAVYVGLTIGLFTALLITYSTSPTRTFLNIFPKRFRDFVERKIGCTLFLFLFLLIMFLPLIIDGTIQLLTSYEGTNLVRVLTGLPMGFAGGYLIGVLIGTLGELRREDRRRKEETSS